MAVELALTKPDATMNEESLRVMMAAAQRYVASGLLPASIKTPQQALTIMQMGRELGIPATYALRNIHVINGKPVASAELLMALVRRTYGQGAIRVREATSESATVEYREQGWDGVSSLTFTIEDAARAKINQKEVWRAYPRAMLRSRAVSEAVRTAFPECIANLYTPEEMGADVTVTDDGEVQITVIEGESDPEAPATESMSDSEREEADGVYAEFATEAIALGHPHKDKLATTKPESLDEATLMASIHALSAWIAKHKPAESAA